MTLISLMTANFCTGFFTMWRGCGPTVGRAIVLNAAQLGTYDQAKQMLIQSG